MEHRNGVGVASSVYSVETTTGNFPTEVCTAVSLSCRNSFYSAQYYTGAKGYCINIRFTILRQQFTMLSQFKFTRLSLQFTVLSPQFTILRPQFPMLSLQFIY